MPVAGERDSVMPVRLESVIVKAIYNKILALTVRNCTYIGCMNYHYQYRSGSGLAYYYRKLSTLNSARRRVAVTTSLDKGEQRTKQVMGESDTAVVTILVRPAGSTSHSRWNLLCRAVSAYDVGRLELISK